MGSALRKESPSIDSLRAFYHSVKEMERSEVIELLGSMNEPEAARELIQLFQDCQWRNTRFQIIRALARHPFQRSLEFLFRVARAEGDIPMAEAAVWSLGQSHHRLAALFLVNFYRTASDILKPSIVGALGQIPDRTLAPEFLAELPKAIQTRQFSLAKNLALTLGELKVCEALPVLKEISLQRNNPSLALSALIAIGKIARDPALVESLEDRFRADPFEYQLFTTVKAQIQFRSQWKLEDYLAKLFEGPSFHPALPFELCQFSPDDVKAGLKLFSDQARFDQLCLALSRINMPEVAEWYLDLIDFDKLSSEQVELALRSLASHYNAEVLRPLAQLRDRSPSDGLLWLETLALSHPDADVEFGAYFASAGFRGTTEALRISAINHLNDFGLTAQALPSKLQAVGRILDTLLDSEPSPAVRARVLRALGSLAIRSKKALAVAKDTLAGYPGNANEVATLLPSCFKYLEHCPEKSATSALLDALEHTQKALPALLTAHLKSLAALTQIPDSHPALDACLRLALKSDSAADCRVEALAFLSRHPRPQLLNEVVACLRGDERIQLAAMIALKSAGSETAADALAPFLASEQKSLSGRALDTLTSLPGLRAKRITIDFLKEHCEDTDICDKVIRCLQPPESPSPYFAETIDGILARFPRHPQLDGLLLLREKMTLGSVTGARGIATVKGADIEALDRELGSRITGYPAFDEAVKSALRSAELPYLHREMFDEYVDKGSCIVEYCKAIDLLLEKSLGKRIIFPKLEHSLHEFESALHLTGLGDEYPSAERVLQQAGLDRHFTSQTLPFHKMTLVAQAIRSGRIVNEHFKTLDGLRAWAVMLLLFGRKAGSGKALIPLKAQSDDQVVTLCKRLCALQEVRNPVAHRQTVVKFVRLDEVRGEVFALLSLIQKLI